MFGRAEHYPSCPQPPASTRSTPSSHCVRGLARAARSRCGRAARARTRSPGSPAGVTNRIEPGNPASPLWLVVTRDSAAAVTTNVEAAAARGRGGLGDASCTRRRGSSPAALERQGRGARGALASASAGSASTLDDDLIALRLQLLPAERERLAALAVDAAAALEDALRALGAGRARLRRPGARRRESRARRCVRCLPDRRRRRRGSSASVIRSRPASRCSRLVMAVVVAERHGLHAAATRFACAGGARRTVSGARARRHSEVERAMLDACAAGATYGDVLRGARPRLRRLGGHPGAWREHYQGGPVGYRQREFEIVPTQTDSRWFDTAIEAGHGARVEPERRRRRQGRGHVSRRARGPPPAHRHRRLAARGRAARGARHRRRERRREGRRGARRGSTRTRPRRRAFPDGADFRIEIPSVEGPQRARRR